MSTIPDLALFELKGSSVLVWCGCKIMGCLLMSCTSLQVMKVTSQLLICNADNYLHCNLSLSWSIDQLEMQTICCDSWQRLGSMIMDCRTWRLEELEAWKSCKDCCSMLEISPALRALAPRLQKLSAPKLSEVNSKVYIEHICSGNSYIADISPYFTCPTTSLHSKSWSWSRKLPVVCVVCINLHLSIVNLTSIELCKYGFLLWGFSGLWHES